MILIFALLLAFFQPSPSADVATGEWAGMMSRSGDHLGVRFDLSADPSVRSTFSAPDLGAIDVPLQRVTLGMQVHWELVGDASTTVFDGAIRGDALTGTFTENGSAGTFALHRVSATTGKRYAERDVAFYNGGVRLGGTLFLPAGTGSHPGIIFVHGSGDEGRWASAFLADYAARHGIAALIYDKRGVGASSGNWRTSTLPDLAADARAGIRLLAQTPGVDSRRIGVYGHSQGGGIAPEIAAGNPLVSFVVAADGPVGPQYLQDIYRVDTYLEQHYSGKQLADAERLYREFVDVARTGGSHAQLRADIRAAGNATWLTDVGIPDDRSWVWDWYPRYAHYDNRSAWKKVRVPVLILFGGKDALVPVKPSIDQTIALLKQGGDPPVTVRVFDDADHTLRVPPKTAQGWPHLPSGFPDVIAAFIFSLS